MSISACATFTLSKRNPPSTFEETCGRHHEALADVKGVAVILFDKNEHASTGIWHRLSDTKYKLCTAVMVTWNRMIAKVAEPPIVMQDLPPGWVEMPDDKSITNSSTALPKNVTQQPEPVFTPGRAQGQSLCYITTCLYTCP